MSLLATEALQGQGNPNNAPIDLCTNGPAVSVHIIYRSLYVVLRMHSHWDKEINLSIFRISLVLGVFIEWAAI